jgi:hypothetical protein
MPTLPSQKLNPETSGKHLVDWLYGGFPKDEWKKYIQESMVTQDIKLYRTLILHKSTASDFQPKDKRSILSASDSMEGSLFASANNMVDYMETSKAYLKVANELLAANKDKYSTLNCDRDELFKKIKELKRNTLKKLVQDYVFVVFELENTTYLSFNEIAKRLSVECMPNKDEKAYHELKEMLDYERECIVRNHKGLKYTQITRYPIHCILEIKPQQRYRNATLMNKVEFLFNYPFLKEGD